MNEKLSEVLAHELCATLLETSSDGKLFFNAIVHKLQEAFEMGYEQALEESVAEIYETIKAIDSLKDKDVK
jgi:hypothetical protein